MNEYATVKGEIGAVKARSEKQGSAGRAAERAPAERIDSRRGVKDVMETVMKAVFVVCGLVAVGFVLIISIYLIISGLPAIREVGLWNFLAGTNWDPANKSGNAEFGILPMIFTSIYGTCGAILIGVPIGFLMAVFLSKVADRRAAAMIREVVDLLAGIPSVVYGLVGMMVLLPLIREGFDLPAGDTLFAAIIVLAIMILPSIISVSETALNAVPREYEEASLALGATELETYFRVSAPAAKSGIAAAVVLGVGRAIGEAMAILMVAGNVANMPSLLSSVKFLTTAIAGEMGYAGDLHRQALFSIGLVLFLFIMLINAALNLFLKHNKEGS